MKVYNPTRDLERPTVAIKRSRVTRWFLAAVVAMALLGLVYAQTDQNAAEVLFEDLRGSDEEARKTAEEKLTLLALEDLENVLPSLQKGLKDPSPEVRFYCAVVLAVAAYDDEKNAIMLSEAAPSLTGALKDDDARVREAAAGALGLVRPSPPSEAVSALVGVLGDREPKVRKAALEALTSVQPIDVELVFAILHAHEDDPSEEVRAEAAKTLARMSANDPDVVWSLTKSLKSSDHFLRQESIRALGKLGPAAAPAIPELEKIAENPTEDRTVRKYASQALRKIKGQ